MEICCNSYYDALQAASGGAGRIELNCALHLGELTPSLASLGLMRKHCSVKVIVMVRPRGGGFCYSEEDFSVMLRGCEHLIRHRVDGIAFDYLREGAPTDRGRNARIISIIRDHGEETVFHQAFNCTSNPHKSIETLIELGAGYLLISGLRLKAVEGKVLLGALQSAYGNSIKILVGSGISTSNARMLMEETGIRQVHNSCRDWMTDPIATSNGVTCGFAEPSHTNCYDMVSETLVRRLLDSLGELGR